MGAPATASARFGTRPFPDARTTPCHATNSTGSRVATGQPRGLGLEGEAFVLPVRPETRVCELSTLPPSHANRAGIAHDCDAAGPGIPIRSIVKAGPALARS